MASAAPPSTAKPARSRTGTLLVAALVVALGALLAHWTWVFLTPPVEVAASPGEGGADLATAARLFGGSVQQAGPASTNTAGLRLKGVVAPSPGKTAGAIFNTGSGRDISVVIDAEIQPGVKLVEVQPDHVYVSRAGVRERIDLEARIASARPGQGARPAPGFRLNVARSGSNNYTLSRKELDDALKDPNQLNYLGRIGPAPQGGVRLEAAPNGSLAQKLGLQPGDVIRKLNGQAVASTGDLARLYTQFATLSLVQTEVMRGSAVVQLNYAIQP